MKGIGLAYALQGIWRTWKTQRNFRFQVLLGFGVIFAGWVLGLLLWQWVAVVLCSCLVLAAEIFNTAIEAAVDLTVGEERRPLAGVAKDAAAGAVLLMAMGALAVGALVLGPRLGRLPTAFALQGSSHPLPLSILVVAFLGLLVMTLVLEVEK